MEEKNPVGTTSFIYGQICNMKKKSSENKTQYMPIGMCFGIAIGTALGVATDNLAVCMPIGLSIGMCIGVLIDAQNRKKSKGDSEDSEDKE